jgi:hypothetical protein
MRLGRELRRLDWETTSSPRQARGLSLSKAVEPRAGEVRATSSGYSKMAASGSWRLGRSGVESVSPDSLASSAVRW